MNNKSFTGGTMSNHLRHWAAALSKVNSPDHRAAGFKEWSPKTTSYWYRFAALFPRMEGRQNFRRQIEEDAVALIERFGCQAYYEADQLSKGCGAIEGSRSRLHWARVKVEIARRQETDVGLSGYVQWE